jgi:predicted Zn-dependent protease
MPPVPRSIEELEKDAAANPNNFQMQFNLVYAYMQAQQADKAGEVLDAVLKNPKVDAQAVAFVVSTYIKMQNMPKVEAGLKRYTEVQPDLPEAWRELAAVETLLNKPDEAMKALRQCAAANAVRRKVDPKAVDVIAGLATDSRFTSLHANPEFQALTGVKP